MEDHMAKNKNAYSKFLADRKKAKRNAARWQKVNEAIVVTKVVGNAVVEAHADHHAGVATLDLRTKSYGLSRLLETSEVAARADLIERRRGVVQVAANVVEGGHKAVESVVTKREQRRIDREIAIQVGVAEAQKAAASAAAFAASQQGNNGQPAAAPAAVVTPII
jgi:hypothetical protein